MALVNSLTRKRFQVYATAGTYSFVVPAGVYWMWYLLVGGGGAGGGCIASSSSASGGSSGCTVRRGVPVTPGETLTVIVGTGGAGVVNAAGGNGVETVVKRGSVVILSAPGGFGGLIGTSSGNPGPGSAGPATTTVSGDGFLLPGGAAANPAVPIANSAGAGGVLPSSGVVAGNGAVAEKLSDNSHGDYFYSGAGGGAGSAAGTGARAGRGGANPLGGKGGAGAVSNAVNGGGGGGGYSSGGNAQDGQGGGQNGKAGDGFGAGGGGAAGSGTPAAGGNGSDGYAMAEWELP